MQELVGTCLQWACCPMLKATCCADKRHCCPETLPVCDVQNSRCLPGSTATPYGEPRSAPLQTKVPAIKRFGRASDAIRVV